MNLRSGLVLHALLAHAVILTARGQVFFPVGLDHLNYEPNVPGTPAGRLYVGDHFRQGNCHFRLDLPQGKKVTCVDFVKFQIGASEVRGVTVTTGEGRQLFFEDSEFERVDKEGHLCDVAPRPRFTPSFGAHAKSGTAIPIGNDADSFAITCDGRFAVVVGANSATPVSLVDFAERKEVDKFAADSNVTWAATFDDGESVVVIQNVPPRNLTNRLRRLKIADRKLVDTGESLATAPNGDFPDYRFKKVFAVAGSKVGVAVAEFGNPQIITFSIPGLRILDSLNGAGGHSGVLSCRGDRFYVRAGSQIRGYTLDPVTGAIGRTPILTITGVGEIDSSSSNFGNALAISRDGSQLIVTEGTAFPNSPSTPRTTFFDAASGARLGYFEAMDGGSPTLVSSASCCAEVSLRLGVELLGSGVIELTSAGNIGSTYELQKSSDLIQWDKLLEFQMVVSPAVHTDPDKASLNAARYYRLMLVR